MKHFTIDAENQIAVHASRKAARETGAGVFASEVQLADLIGPDNKRLVEIWNSLPGVTPVTKFANRKVATERIWKAIQDLGMAAAAPAAQEAKANPIEVPEAVAEEPVAEPIPDAAQPEPPIEDVAIQTTSEAADDAPVEQPAEAAEAVASVGEQEPTVAPPEAESGKKAKAAKKAPKAKKPAKSEGVREGSKTAIVLALMQRAQGATLAELMTATSWQKHSVRGFISIAGKKQGVKIESSKNEAGDRLYKIVK
jgi:hypothetical protein